MSTENIFQSVRTGKLKLFFLTTKKETVAVDQSEDGLNVFQSLSFVSHEGQILFETS